MYFSHAAYQSAFFLWISAPDPLGRPNFLIVVFPFTVVCFVVPVVLDDFFVTNNEDKKCCLWFFYCCRSFCCGGVDLEKESHQPLHVTSPMSQYALLH